MFEKAKGEVGLFEVERFSRKIHWIEAKSTEDDEESLHSVT